MLWREKLGIFIVRYVELERVRKMEALVSIVVPVYNAETFLKDTIESVLRQTYSTYELILVDDGSKDSSLSICNKYAEIDSRICVIAQDNSGAGAARNTGIARARGKYVMFLDADDTYEPTIVDQLVSKIEETGSDMAVCGYYTVSQEQRNIVDTGFHQELRNQEIFDAVEDLCKHKVFNLLWNKIFRNEIIKTYKLAIDQSLIVGEDFRFVLEYLDKCQSIAFIDKPLYNYITQNSFTTRRYREDDFECRRKNAAYYVSFCEKHNLRTNCYFQYVKLLFSHCMQMENKSCNMSRKQKNQAIRRILLSDEMKKALLNAYAEDRYSWILLQVAKTNNVMLVVLLSKIILFVRKKNLVHWDRVSV